MQWKASLLYSTILFSTFLFNVFHVIIYKKYI